MCAVSASCDDRHTLPRTCCYAAQCRVEPVNHLACPFQVGNGLAARGAIDHPPRRVAQSVVKSNNVSWLHTGNKANEHTMRRPF